MTQQNNWQQINKPRQSVQEQKTEPVEEVFMIDGIKITVRRADVKAAKAQEDQLKSVLIKVKARQSK